MRFILEKPIDNIYTLMRKIGYSSGKQGRNDNEFSFIRRISRAEYPRFHIYLRVEPKTGNIFLNLHLDQKRPVYKNVPAHSAEYDEEGVAREVERIKKIIGKAD